MVTTDDRYWELLGDQVEAGLWGEGISVYEVWALCGVGRVHVEDVGLEDMGWPDGQLASKQNGIE